MAISSPGTYTLAKDLESDGSCLKVKSNDVIIDCQDKNIFFSSDKKNSHGILAISSNNIEVKNCNIQELGASDNLSSGIKLRDSSAALIHNNTISSSVGINLVRSNSGVIKSNTVSTRPIPKGVGVSIRSSKSVEVHSNSIKADTTGMEDGIIAGIRSTKSFDGIIRANIIDAPLGILIRNDYNTLIDSLNQIFINPIKKGFGVKIVSSEDILVDGNIIKADLDVNNSSTGIRSVRSINSKVSTNKIDSLVGVSVFKDVGTSITNENIIRLSSSTKAVGVRSKASKDIVINNNHIYEYGVEPGASLITGIESSDSQEELIQSNNIFSSIGIRIKNNINPLIKNNKITLNSVHKSIGVDSAKSREAIVHKNEIKGIDISNIGVKDAYSVDSNIKYNDISGATKKNISGARLKKYRKHLMNTFREV